MYMIIGYRIFLINNLTEERVLSFSAEGALTIYAILHSIEERNEAGMVKKTRYFIFIFYGRTKGLRTPRSFVFNRK